MRTYNCANGHRCWEVPDVIGDTLILVSNLDAWEIVADSDGDVIGRPARKAFVPHDSVCGCHSFGAARVIRGCDLPSFVKRGPEAEE